VTVEGTRGMDTASPARRTEVLTNPHDVVNTTFGFFANANTRMDIAAGVLTPPPANQSEEMQQMGREYLELVKRGVRLRVIGEITKENLGHCKEVMKNIDVRHLQGVSSYFGVSDSEYVALPGTQEFHPEGPLLYSNEESFVRHHQMLFDTLWGIAIPGDVRVGALESGEQLGETRLTFSTQEIMDSASGFVDEMKEEALVIVPQEGSIRDNKAFFRKLTAKAGTATVKLLGRFSKDEAPLLKEFESEGVQVRTLLGGRITNLSVGIYDRKGMGLVQYVYPDRQRRPSGETYLVGVISTSTQMISGIAAIFDSLWEETELRQRAELMQDILVHDIRNYNQVTRANLELLRDRVTDEKSLRYVDSALGSVDGSTDLIQKTRMLANVLSSVPTPLSAVSLADSIDRSLALVTQVFPEKKLMLTRAGSPKADVLADTLLDQVFVNILSNAARYTDGVEVPLEIRVRQEEGSSPTAKYWVIEITDHGRGIPDDMKGNAALRYLGISKGRGLGLSIAHALVVHRYAGKIDLRNRIERDHSKGTKVEVWLQEA
jgi:signal transduction histidine kinase